MSEGLIAEENADCKPLLGKETAMDGAVVCTEDRYGKFEPVPETGIGIGCRVVDG